METVLDALPAQPLTAEDIAALNDAATVRLLPYTWYGEQVIAALLLHDKREAGDGTGEPELDRAEEADTTDEHDDADGEEKKEFGTRRSSTVGTVELLEDDSLAPDADGQSASDGQDGGEGRQGRDGEREDGGGADGKEAEEDLHVYAVGYDDAAGWIVIAEIDPDTELTDAEPLVREWISDRYHDQIVDRLAVGPSEYDLDRE